jgi:predicted signal transduction protein with EAL and GGDEF domain
VAERLLGALAKPFSLAGTQVQQHASIGAVVFDGTNKDCTELVQDADAALYEAKRQGKGHHVLFTSTMPRGQRPALSPPADPPLVRSGADTPRSW